MAEELVWGRGQGCDFVTQSCLQIITDQFQQKYEMFICIRAHVDLIDPLCLLPAACMLKFSTCNNDKAIIICFLLEWFHYTGWHDDGLCCLMELYNTISLLLCKCTCGSLAMELISYPTVVVQMECFHSAMRLVVLAVLWTTFLLLSAILSLQPLLQLTLSSRFE